MAPPTKRSWARPRTPRCSPTSTTRSPKRAASKARISRRWPARTLTQRGRRTAGRERRAAGGTLGRGQLEDLLGRQWAGEVEALPEVAAHPLKPLQLIDRLDP